jgi:uncharacterized protein YcfJ
MPAFTPERRTHTQQRIPAGGDRRHASLGKDVDANRDPISGAPGAHPVGVGLGAAVGGMAAAAAAGTVAGPVGTAVGAAVGAIAGGLAGKGIAEKIDPTVEEAYWRENYRSQPFFEKGYTFDDYRPGYRTGWEGRSRYAGKEFHEVESDLEFDYEKHRGRSKLEWDRNRLAARAAWDRLEVD